MPIAASASPTASPPGSPLPSASWPAWVSRIRKPTRRRGPADLPSLTLPAPASAIGLPDLPDPNPGSCPTKRQDRFSEYASIHYAASYFSGAPLGKAGADNCAERSAPHHLGHFLKRLFQEVRKDAVVCHIHWPIDDLRVYRQPLGRGCAARGGG